MVLTIMCCLTALGQQTPFNDLVSLNLPKGAEKITKTNSQDNFYNVNGIHLQLYSGYANIRKDYLEDTEKGMKGMFLDLNRNIPPEYKSQIKVINNYKVLVIYYEKGEHIVSTYTFFCVSSTDTSFFNGIMEFNKSEKDKATTVLDEMLKSLRFK